MERQMVAVLQCVRKIQKDSQVSRIWSVHCSHCFALIFFSYSQNLSFVLFHLFSYLTSFFLFWFCSTSSASVPSRTLSSCRSRFPCFCTCFTFFMSHLHSLTFDFYVPPFPFYSFPLFLPPPGGPNFRWFRLWWWHWPKDGHGGTSCSFSLKRSLTRCWILFYWIIISALDKHCVGDKCERI